MDEKTDEYYKLLHTELELELLSGSEYKRALNDRNLIADNIVLVEHMYKVGCEKGYEPSTIIKRIVNSIKVSKFRDVLFADELDFSQEEHFSEEQQLAYDVRMQEINGKLDFIKKHIDEIDSHYQDCIFGENQEIYKEMTEQQILQEAIDKVRKEIENKHPDKFRKHKSLKKDDIR